MYLKITSFVAAATVLLMTAASLMAQSFLDQYPPPQNTDDSLVIDLEHPVIVAHRVLEPGLYRVHCINIAGADLPVLRIRQVNHPEVNLAVTISPAFRESAAAENQVTFYHVGKNYYFKRMWIRGMNYGYTFFPPKGVAP
jgi:hypothetical protein